MKTLSDLNFSFENENFNDDEISTFGNRDSLAEKLEEIKNANGYVDLATLSKTAIEENKIKGSSMNLKTVENSLNSCKLEVNKFFLDDSEKKNKTIKINKPNSPCINNRIEKKNINKTKTNVRSTSVAVAEKSKKTNQSFLESVDLRSITVSSMTSSKIANKNIKENNVSIESMLIRFKEKQNNTARKIEEMKKRIEHKELANLKKIPDINKANFKLEKKDFFARLEIKKVEVQQKKRILIEKELQKRQEEAKLNPRLNQKKNEEEMRKAISAMYEWKKQKEEKLKTKSEVHQTKKLKECTFKPGLNSNSLKLIDAQSKFIINKHKSASERLFKNEYDKDKQLNNLYYNLIVNTFSPDKYSLASFQNDSRVSDKRKNLIRNESEESNLRDKLMKSGDIRGSISKSLTPTTSNSDYSIPINPNFIEFVSLKESKIIAELVKKRMSGK